VLLLWTQGIGTELSDENTVVGTTASFSALPGVYPGRSPLVRSLAYFCKKKKLLPFESGL
jgi:hypothetical protein